VVMGFMGFLSLSGASRSDVGNCSRHARRNPARMAAFQRASGGLYLSHMQLVEPTATPGCMWTWVAHFLIDILCM
jgi:hypothetical protein